MLKRDTLGKASSKSLSEAFKCGECLHHSKSCHPHRDSVCSKMGVRAFAIAPKCFTPDVTKVITNAEQFVVIAAVINEMTPQQRKIFQGMLRGVKTPGKQFKFGTKLYLRVGGEALTSYRCGYVVGYTSSGELILAGSADRKSAGATFFAYLKSNEGLLTHKEWQVKRKQLIDAGKFDYPRRDVSSNMEKYLNYEVPSIDTSPDFFDPPKKRKSKRATELTEFIVS